MWAQVYVGLLSTFILLCRSPADCTTQRESVPLGIIQEGDQRCVRKVMMETRVVTDEVVECSHEYRESCHTTYVTEYSSHQEEKCKESYVKECYISFSPSVTQHPVDICTHTLSKNCSIKAAPVCQMEPITSCSTVQELHRVEETRPECRIEQQQVECQQEQAEDCGTVSVSLCSLVKANVTKARPNTTCSRTKTKICGPGPCPVLRGELQCRRETRGVIHQTPIEECSLSVKPDCRLVTRLVPRLTPKQECQDVPHEVCVRVRKNPRKVSRPVIKIWCYKPNKIR